MSCLGIGLGVLTLASPARAETILERVARTGALHLVGPVDQPPMLSRDAQGQPQGYGALVARRIADLVGQAVGKPVRLVVETVGDSALISQRLGEGKAELACGLPFTWAHDEVLDFTLPIGISGLRLMAPARRFDGSPAGLAGKRIGVVRESLGDTQLRGMQPAARVQTYGTLAAAVAALGAGQVDGVIGDSLLLKGLAQQQGLQGQALTPEIPYLRYAVVCAVPENASAFRSLANRAIATLQQGYVNGNAADVAAAALEAPAPGQSAMEARLQRIAAAARARQQAATDASPLGPDAISFVVLGPGGVGWANGGWNNGGFYNGGWGNGGFRNGGFYNGGFRNGGFNNW